MSKNIILHIGTQKTGTTAIQMFLTNNQSQLKDEGFEYLDPQTGKLGLDNINHGHLALCLTGYWRNTNHQIDREEAWGMLKSAVEESEYTVIVSSELLSTPQILPHLPFIKESLSGLNVKVIIYLRRQDIFVQSVYKERLKVNEKESFEIAYQYGDYKKVLDFRTIVNQWAHYLGKENIYIRPYEKRQLSKGDILTDFMDVIGSKITTEMQLPGKHINAPMNRHILEISRELNQLNLKEPAINAFKWWMHDVIEVDSNGPFVDHSVISPAQRLAIIDSYIDGNRYIAKTYLNRPDGTLFYDQLPNMADSWEEYCGMPAIHTAKILAEIFKRSNLLESFGSRKYDFLSELKATPRYLEVNTGISEERFVIKRTTNIVDDQEPERAKPDTVLAGFPNAYADRVRERMQKLVWFQKAGVFDSEHFRNKKVLDWEAGDAAFAVALLLLGAKSVNAIDSWTTLEAVPAEVRSMPGFEFQKIGVSEYLQSNLGAKNSYDFVFSNTVTEHIADLPVAFDSIRLLLKDSGYYFNNHDNYYSPCGSHDHGFWFYGENSRIVFQGVSCWKTKEKCSASEAHRTRLCQDLPWTWSDKNDAELTPSNCDKCRYFKRSQEWPHIRAFKDFPEIFNDGSFLSMREGSSLNKITPFQLLQLLSEAGFKIIHISRTMVQNEPTEDLFELGLSKLDLQTATVRTLCKPRT